MSFLSFLSLVLHSFCSLMVPFRGDSDLDGFSHYSTDDSFPHLAPQPSTKGFLLGLLPAAFGCHTTPEMGSREHDTFSSLQPILLPIQNEAAWKNLKPSIFLNKRIFPDFKSCLCAAPKGRRFAEILACFSYKRGMSTHALKRN